MRAASPDCSKELKRREQGQFLKQKQTNKQKIWTVEQLKQESVLDKTDILFSNDDDPRKSKRIGESQESEENAGCGQKKSRRRPDGERSQGKLRDNFSL